MLLAWQCILHSPSPAGRFGTPDDPAVGGVEKAGGARADVREAPDELKPLKPYKHCSNTLLSRRFGV